MFDPRSIAVIGASADRAKRGYQAIRALQQSGYAHPVYPVNPRTTEILGLDVIASIDQLPTGIDVALIALPGPAVPQALRACGAMGIAGAVVLANGFREIGSAGAELEAELLAAIADSGVRVIGPNTSGVLNAASGANLVGLQDVPNGPVSVITQSGNMLLSLVNDVRALRGPGFHAYVGLGNQSDVRYDECVTELAAQPNTGAIAVHAEGLRDGRAFLIAVAQSSTPVVMLRGGRSTAGQRTALSHTGSIAGSDAVATALLRQAGVELVRRSDELAVVAGALATSTPMGRGRRVAILSDGGGHATLAVDALTEHGVELAELSETTRSALRALLGPAASVVDPVDVAGATDADPTVFAAAVELLMADPSVGLVLMIGLFGGYHRRFDSRLEEAENDTAAVLLAASAQYGTPLLVQSCFAAEDLGPHRALRAGGIPVVASIDHAARIAAALDNRRIRRETALWRSPLRLPSAAAPITSAVGVLTEPEGRRLLEEFGISTGPWTFASTPSAVARAIADYGRPCAIKVVSPQAIHKSDVGGVRLGVGPDTAAANAEAVIAAVTAAIPAARIDGMVVSPMAAPGVELLVGATRDPIFGPVVAFGTGGVLVEALADVTFRAAPFTELEAHEMIRETVASRLLDGYRGLPSVDRDTLARFLVRVGEVVAAHPEIAELDLNPVIAAGTAVLPVDVRIVITPVERIS
ncbi:acetate--CoA ligase family protein [Nocardia sp. NPDC127579]|uniref:acetate--CoA ligase family protein n=1 Tax=Nocardia sp. NPDC127579 TaxID=3345402 RepID=UPI00363906F3